MSGYAEYLRSRHWMQLRILLFQKYGRRCVACGTKGRSIEAHHLIYRDPIQSCTEADLMPLCRRCHHLSHKDSRVLDAWHHLKGHRAKWDAIIGALARFHGISLPPDRKPVRYSGKRGRRPELNRVILHPQKPRRRWISVDELNAMSGGCQ